MRSNNTWTVSTATMNNAQLCDYARIVSARVAAGQGSAVVELVHLAGILTSRLEIAVGLIGELTEELDATDNRVEGAA